MIEINNIRSGRTQRQLKGEVAFNSFVPTPLQDVRIEWSDALAAVLADASFALGEFACAYDALDEEEKAALVERSIESEAASSWKLSEGRELGLPLAAGLELFAEEGAMGALGLRPLDAFDQGEIEDLATAMRYTYDPMDDLPVSKRLLENVHYLITQGPRYEKRYPGEFRRSPNWIAGPGSTLATATFVTPVGDDMIEAFSELEHYIHAESNEPPLVRVALAHYQFEVIHPFIDGNGRIGRILTTLMLMEYGLLPKPILPLSDVLRERATAYYTEIERCEFKGDYERWILFFLLAIQEAAGRGRRALV